MSTLPSPQITLPGGAVVSARKLTYREARYVQARLAQGGDGTMQDAALIAGFPAWMARDSKRKIEHGEVEALLSELRGTLAQHAVEAALIDAAEIHEYLTDAIRAKRSDIQNPDHSYKPLDQWPEIWQRMVEDGDVVVRRESERSHDGATVDKAGGWDETGDKIISVRYKFGRKAELLKLAMQHKAVDAMARTEITVEQHIHVTIEDKLQRARLLASQDVIEIEAKPVGLEE